MTQAGTGAGSRAGTDRDIGSGTGTIDGSTTAASTGTPLLSVRGVHKRYAVPVLTDVHLDLHGGEVHALMGANGAGKSTLTRILCGLTAPDEGHMTIAGTTYAPRERRDAERGGVQLVMQELNLIGTLTVAENLFLNRLPRRFGFVCTRVLQERATAALTAVGLHDIDPQTPLGSLGVGQQQLVEVAAALDRPCRVLVLDEPTAALTDPEIDLLFSHIGRLREQGVGVLYISHRMDEIRRIADRVTVLRDGRVVGTRAAADLSSEEIVQLMVNPPGSGGSVHRDTTTRGAGPAPPGAAFRRGRSTGDIALRVEGLCRGDLVRDVSFDVRRGEVLGIAGLMGAGRSELLMAVFGAHAGRASGEVLVEGRRVSIKNPADAIRHGIGFVTEDRKRFGLVLDQTILNNMTLAGLARISGRFVTNVDAEAAAGNRAAKELRVKANSVFTVAGTLSGGNQQKVVLAKWLLTNPKVLFLDEPTRGIDVGAKQEIYAQINLLASRGLAIVLVSSELPEVLGLSDRVLVLHEGRVTGEFTRADATPESVMACATGHKRHAA